MSGVFCEGSLLTSHDMKRNQVVTGDRLLQIVCGEVFNLGDSIVLSYTYREAQKLDFKQQ